MLPIAPRSTFISASFLKLTRQGGRTPSSANYGTSNKTLGVAKSFRPPVANQNQQPAPGQSFPNTGFKHYDNLAKQQQQQNRQDPSNAPPPCDSSCEDERYNQGKD